MSGEWTGAGAQRIGSAERDAAIAALRAHAEAGRLTPEEYEDRQVAASRATTWGELTPLFADLPEPRPAPVAAALAQAPAPVPAAAGLPVPERLRETIMAVTPIAALILFFVTHSWLWFLAIPLMGALLYGRDRGHAPARPPLPLTVAASPRQSEGSENCGARPSPWSPPRWESSGASSATATAVSSAGSTGPRSPGVPSSSPVAMALSRTVTSRSSASAGRSAGRSGVTALRGDVAVAGCVVGRCLAHGHGLPRGRGVNHRRGPW